MGCNRKDSGIEREPLKGREGRESVLSKGETQDPATRGGSGGACTEGGGRKRDGKNVDRGGLCRPRVSVSTERGDAKRLPWLVEETRPFLQIRKRSPLPFLCGSRSSCPWIEGFDGSRSTVPIVVLGIRPRVHPPSTTVTVSDLLNGCGYETSEPSKEREGERGPVASWELSNATRSALGRDEAQKRTSGSKGSDTNPIRTGHKRSSRERDSFGWNRRGCWTQAVPWGCPRCATGIAEQRPDRNSSA
eukprot:scaffold1318_cov362-Pavlova_lutheri.AAC.14